MAEGAGIAVRIVRIAHHPRQLQADFDLHVHGHRRGVFADVVGVVGQGEDLRDQPRQQQIAGHVADVARTVEWHRFLQRSGQRMQLAAQARLEGAVARLERSMGGDRRRVLGMEIAAPVHVVAQELDHEFFQQGVVLAIRAEEAGVQRAARGIRVGVGHCSSQNQPSGLCVRAMP